MVVVVVLSEEVVVTGEVVVVVVCVGGGGGGGDNNGESMPLVARGPTRHMIIKAKVLVCNDSGVELRAPT
jgi:hypothetical protein